MSENTRSARRRSAWVTWLMALALIAVMAVGVRLIMLGTKTTEPEAAPLPDQTFSVNPDDIPKASSTEPPEGCTPRTGENRLTIPRLCMSAELVPTTIAGNELVIPGNAQQAGVWDGGPTVARAKKGTTLVAGHVAVSGQGEGALFDLAQVEPGDLVEAFDAQGRVTRWLIIELRAVHKAALPQDVFKGQKGSRRLVIVTCGGDIITLPDGHRVFEDNVVATAVPVPLSA